MSRALELRRRCEIPEAWRASLEAHALAFAAPPRALDEHFAAFAQAAWDSWVLADEQRREAICRDDRGRVSARAYLEEVLDALIERKGIRS